MRDWEGVDTEGSGSEEELKGDKGKGNYTKDMWENNLFSKRKRKKKLLAKKRGKKKMNDPTEISGHGIAEWFFKIRNTNNP